MNRRNHNTSFGIVLVVQVFLPSYKRVSLVGCIICDHYRVLSLCVSKKVRVGCCEIKSPLGDNLSGGLKFELSICRKLVTRQLQFSFSSAETVEVTSGNYHFISPPVETEIVTFYLDRVILHQKPRLVNRQIELLSGDMSLILLDFSMDIVWRLICI